MVQENFVSFSEVFEELTVPEKRELLQLLIKEILYDSDHGKIRMALRPLQDIGPLMINHQNGVFGVVPSWLPILDNFRTLHLRFENTIIAKS